MALKEFDEFRAKPVDTPDSEPVKALEGEILGIRKPRKRKS
jgi:hypothetical protein